MAFGAISSEWETVLNKLDVSSFTISDDQEALARIAPLLDWNPGPLSTPARKHQLRKARTPTMPEDLAILAIALTKDWAIHQWAEHWEDGIQKPNQRLSLETLKKQDGFLTWLTTGKGHPAVSDAHALLKGYGILSAHPQPDIESREEYEEFARNLLIRFPDWTGTDSAWVNLATHQGSAGIIQRIENSFRTHTTQHTPLDSATGQKEKAFVGRFLHQHVLPFLKSYLQVSLYALQTTSNHRAWETWQRVQQWATRKQEEISLTRLCGTWQWLIHNHQNHGDHKTLMVYPPPSQYDRMEPKPSKVQVRGDTLYIRWEFPRGIIQEESLLFSDKDRMLSGTFINNMGPHGNITARRMAPCQKE